MTRRSELSCDPHRLAAWQAGEDIWSDHLTDEQQEAIRKLVDSDFPVNKLAPMSAVTFHVTEAVRTFKKFTREGVGDLNRAGRKRAGAKHFASIRDAAAKLDALLDSDEFADYRQLYLSTGYSVGDDYHRHALLAEFQNVDGAPPSPHFGGIHLDAFRGHLRELMALSEDAEGALGAGGKAPNALDRFFAWQIRAVWETLGTQSAARPYGGTDWPYLDFMRKAGRVVRPNFNGRGAADWLYDRDRDIPTVVLGRAPESTRK